MKGREGGRTGEREKEKRKRKKTKYEETATVLKDTKRMEMSQKDG